MQIGALTNFDALQEEEEEEQDKKENKTDLGDTEGLTVEELEQRRLEEFRVKKKEEMDSLTNEMNGLKDKLSEIKKAALTTQTEVEEKRKQLEQEEQEYIGYKKDTKAKEAILESLGGNQALEEKKEQFA